MIPNDVGIVVIGRNEGERLIGCLSSVKSHAGCIVYVDSGSSDGSVGAAEQLGASVVKLDLTRPFTAARARNEGFAVLKALRPDIRFVQFIDGDCILADGWLDKALFFVEQRPNAAIVCGRRREYQPSASIYNLLCDREWNTPIGQTLACGGDALVRVAAFEEVDGYRSQLIAGEEPELCVRLREKRWEIWRLDVEMTRHDAAMTKFGQWWVRTVRGGYAFAEVSRLHRASPFGIWKRQTGRAVFWGGLLPLIICLGTIVHPAAALAGTLAYGLQICRIAFAQRPISSQSWSYALFVTLGKFAEFQGIMKFYRYQWGRRAITLIEYK
jgi:glycosyltransferase involved in cell wall biosynthesis